MWALNFFTVTLEIIQPWYYCTLNFSKDIFWERKYLWNEFSCNFCEDPKLTWNFIRWFSVIQVFAIPLPGFSGSLHFPLSMLLFGNFCLGAGVMSIWTLAFGYSPSYQKLIVYYLDLITSQTCCCKYFHLQYIHSLSVLSYILLQNNAAFHFVFFFNYVTYASVLVSVVTVLHIYCCHM